MGLRRRNYQGTGGVHMVRSYMICTANQISYGDQIRKIKWAGHVAGGNERRGAYRILVENPKIKGTIGRHRLQWVGNINVDL
jgi:hypothetical protein